MEDTDGGLHPAVDGQSLDERWKMNKNWDNNKNNDDDVDDNAGMGIKNGKVSWKVGVWRPQKAPSGGPGGNAPGGGQGAKVPWSWSWSFLTKTRRKNCIKQPCIFQFCQFLTRCKTITF